MRAIGGAQSGFSSFKLFVGKRFQKVRKERRGGKGLECRYNSLIIMTVRAKMRERDKSFLVEGGMFLLSFNICES